MEQPNPKLDIPRVTTPYVEESTSKTGRYMTLSLFVHAAMVATVALMSFPAPELRSEPIQIEFGNSDTTSMPEGTADSGSGAAPSALDDSKDSSEAVTVAKAQTPPAPAEPEKIPDAPKAEKTTSPTAPPPAPPKPAAPVAKVAPQPVPPPPKTTAPPKVSDAKAPNLETSDTGEVPVAQLDDKDMSDEFEKIDQDQRQAEFYAKKKQEEEQREAQRLADERAAAAAARARDEEDKRRKDAEAVAAEAARKLQAARDARAKERADAEVRAKAQAMADAAAAREAAAAADAAAKEAREAQAAKDAEAAAAAAAGRAGKGHGGGQHSEGIATAEGGGDGNGNGAGMTSGDGSGTSENPEGTKQVAGIPGGVRTLGQLRQRPGNRLPQYDRQERLLRQEGDVVFYAYVNRDGSLSQFKKGTGTGYENLDDKTLAALRKWKFYPGQEGWVEMPFQWTLKGEAQEAGTLRR